MAWEWTNIELPFQLSVSGEPLVDCVRWEREKILSIYCQEEPEKLIETNKSGPVDGFPAPLLVLDVRFADGVH